MFAAMTVRDRDMAYRVPWGSRSPCRPSGVSSRARGGGRRVDARRRRRRARTPGRRGAATGDVLVVGDARRLDDGDLAGVLRRRTTCPATCAPSSARSPPPTTRVGRTSCSAAAPCWTASTPTRRRSRGTPRTRPRWPHEWAWRLRARRAGARRRRLRGPAALLPGHRRRPATTPAATGDGYLGLWRALGIRPSPSTAVRRARRRPGLVGTHSTAARSVLLQPRLLVRVGDERAAAGRRQEADDVHHVPVRRRRAAGQGAVRRGEAVGDVGSVAEGEVRAAVRDVEPGRAPRRLDPVHDAGEVRPRPEHVAGLEVAVQERAVVRRRVLPEDRERPLPGRGVARPLRHDVLGRPCPRLVGPRPLGGPQVVDRRQVPGERLEVGVDIRSRSTSPGQQRHQVRGLAGRASRRRPARSSAAPARRCRPAAAGSRARGWSARRRGCATARWSSAAAPPGDRRRW